MSRSDDRNGNSNLSVHNHGPWIRGVNLGGWLVLERYITPYLYALTDCHLRGDLCWYPHQLSAPPTSDRRHRLCDSSCHGNHWEYPVDEWSLASAFRKNHHPQAGTDWLNHHFEHFITKDDLIRIKNAGITHVRVPLPHWILGNTLDDEAWILGDRWNYFLRLCDWIREIGGLQVWPNLHTAPGSQNGFDNSGLMNKVFTCDTWSDNPENVQRTLVILDEISKRIHQDKLLDVVTGFGLLNEPYGDCTGDVYTNFMEDGLAIVRENLGPDVSIFVSDNFFAPKYNNGTWWLDSQHDNTYLDTHFYHVFDDHVRALSPRQHVDLVCHADSAQGQLDASCCYLDPPNNTKVSTTGVRRISTEWSAAFDCHPGELLKLVMQGISENGVAPLLNRTLSKERQAFLKSFVRAQIVSYEAADSTLSDGWFYWTIKMEGGAFAEWDFSRGLQEGWIPDIADPSITSQEVYGTCDDILNRTNDTGDVVHPYPWGDIDYWSDGIVLDTSTHPPTSTDQRPWNSSSAHHGMLWWLYLGVIVVSLVAIKLISRHRRSKYSDYSTVGDCELHPSSANMLL